MYENYNTCVSIEADTLVSMIDTGILPACAKDLAIYSAAPDLAGKRTVLYSRIMAETKKLKELIAVKPSVLSEEANFLCETIKPQMAAVRVLVDEAEGLIESSLYPYPTYQDMVYSHHF